MITRDDLAPKQNVNIVCSNDAAAANDLLPQSIAESAGALHLIFSNDKLSADLFPQEKIDAFEQRIGYSFSQKTSGC